MNPMNLPENIHNGLGDIVKGLVQLTFPNTCPDCGDRLPGLNIPLCTACLQRVERADPDMVRRRVEHLEMANGVFDFVFVLWIFDKGGALQKVHHLLKYGNRPRYGVSLGKLIGQGIPKEVINRRKFDYITPIPLHPARFYERGYNQSRLLALGISQTLSVPVRPEVLQRVRATRSQTHLSRPDRWKNVHEAFVVADSGQVEGANIVLVDDVVTTGATLTAAAHALLQSGANTIGLAALAIARD